MHLCACLCACVRLNVCVSWCAVGAPYQKWWTGLGRWVLCTYVCVCVLVCACMCVSMSWCDVGVLFVLFFPV